MVPFTPSLVVLPAGSPDRTVKDLEKRILIERWYRIDSRDEPPHQRERPLVERPWVMLNLGWALAGRRKDPARPLVEALITDHRSSLASSASEQLALIGVLLQNDVRVVIDDVEWTSRTYQQELNRVPESDAVLALVEDLEANYAEYLKSRRDERPLALDVMYDTWGPRSYAHAVWRAHDPELSEEKPTRVMRRLQLEGYRNKAHNKVVWDVRTARAAMTAPLPDLAPYGDPSGPVEQVEQSR